MARFPTLTAHTLVAPLRATLLDRYGSRELERCTLEVGTLIQQEDHGELPADIAALVDHAVVRVRDYRYSVRRTDLAAATGAPADRRHV